MRLALFDLDHTLIPLDSDYAWGEFTVALGWRDAHRFSEANDGFYADYKAGTLDIHRYVRFAIEAVRERGLKTAREAHARFMAEVVLPSLKDSALALVRAHQAAGDTVVIVTATNEFVTRPIAQAFGVDELIAIELDTERFYGHFEGDPQRYRGKGELDRIRELRALATEDEGDADLAHQHRVACKPAGRVVARRKSHRAVANQGEVDVAVRNRGIAGQRIHADRAVEARLDVVARGRVEIRAQDALGQCDVVPGRRQRA